jgi:hypothetical protein
MMTVRRKEVRPIILASLGVALSVLLNSVRVNKNSSEKAAQTFEFQPSDDVSPDLNDDLPNIEEDEDSDAQESQADLDRTWLDKLLSFVGQPS